MTFEEMLQIFEDREVSLQARRADFLRYRQHSSAAHMETRLVELRALRTLVHRAYEAKEPS